MNDIMNDIRTEVYTQEHATIYGHNVWHYLADTTIGQIHIVQYEARGMEINTKLFFNRNDLAEKEFRKCCNGLLNGKLL